MIEYKDQTFRKLYDRAGTLCLENMSYRGPHGSISCKRSLTNDGLHRLTLNNVSIKN